MRDDDNNAETPVGTPLWESIVAAVAAVAAVDPSEVTPETRLLDDLKIYGEDWDEVLRRLPEAQETDWTGFKFSDYFDDEIILIHLLRRLLRRRRRPLRLAHLAAVLARRKWFEP